MTRPAHNTVEAPREVVDRVVLEKMEGNRTAIAPGHLNRIVWNEIKDSPALIEAFVMDAVNVAYIRITERQHTTKRAAQPAPVVNLATRRANVQAAQQEATIKTEGYQKGRDKFATALESVRNMRFANGKGILDQTVEHIQNLGSWSIAILRALPKNAKPKDTLRQLGISLEQVTKLRTFD